VHNVLVRYRVARRSRIERVTGEPIRLCERDRSGALIQVDAAKFGSILQRRAPIRDPGGEETERERERDSARHGAARQALPAADLQVVWRTLR